MANKCIRLPSFANTRGLGITCCTIGERVAVWSRRSVALYYTGCLSQPPSIITTSFNIYQVLISQQKVVCLDDSGNIYTFPPDATSAPKLHPMENTEKESRTHGIQYFQFIDETGESLLCLNHHHNFVLMSLEKHTYSTFTLDIPDKYCTKIKENIIVKVCMESVDPLTLKKFLKSEIEMYGILVIFSSDRRSVWAFCLCKKEQRHKITPSLLYISPVYVREVQVCHGPSVLLALESGSVVILNGSTAKIVHLNASIHRMLAVSNDKVFYTDGVHLWCAENFSSGRELVFKKLLVKHVRDLTSIGETILCITYSNLLYSLTMEAKDTKLGTVNDGYMCVPEKLAGTSDIVTELKRSIEDNNEILKKIKSENTHMLAVALSRHNTMLADHISITAKVIRDIDEEMRDSEIVQPQFSGSPYLVLLTLRISPSIRHHLADVCTELNGTFQMHVRVCSSIPTVTAIPLKPKYLDRFLCVLPLNTEKTQIQIDVDIAGRIKGPNCQKQDFWTVLFSSTIQLDAEHFILCSEDRTIARANTKSETDVIIKIANLHHGAFLQFHLPKPATTIEEFTCFLDLPENFQDKLSKEDVYEETMDSKTREYLVKILGAAEFARGHLVKLRVRASSVALRVERDPGTVALRIDGPPHVAWRLRQLLARVLWPRSPLRVPHAHYARLEGLQRELRASDGADALKIAHQFHKYALSALPL